MARHAGKLVEAVVVPLEVECSTMVGWDGRLVAISEWVEGSMADPTEAVQVAAAGRLLADIHGALVAWARSASPAESGYGRPPYGGC